MDHAVLSIAGSPRTAERGVGWGVGLSTLVVDFDPGTQAFWCRFQAPGRQVFSAEMLSELLLWRDRVAEHAAVVGAKFHVMASGRPGVFNRGGDLELLSRLIRDHDRAGLMDYGNSCVDMVWANHIGWDAGLTTIAVVEGDALGGGLEAALSSDIVIAERGVRMGFPEVRFDLFPGMGAYSFLSRRIGGHAAWHLMESGELLEAELLQEIGIVDILAEPGEILETVAAAMRREARSRHGRQTIRKIHREANPVTREELDRILALWVENALALDRTSLLMMERIVKRQQKLRP